MKAQIQVKKFVKEAEDLYLQKLHNIKRLKEKGNVWEINTFPFFYGGTCVF